MESRYPTVPMKSPTSLHNDSTSGEAIGYSLYFICLFLKNPGTGKILKMPSGKQKHNNNTSGQETDKGQDPDAGKPMVCTKG